MLAADVGGDGTPPGTPERAVPTAKGLVALVHGADVPGDVILPGTPERAVLAAKGLVALVHSADVGGDVTLLCTPVRAVRAAKGLVIRVLLTVCVEMALAISSIRAVTACILLPARPHRRGPVTFSPVKSWAMWFLSYHHACSIEKTCCHAI